MSRGLDAVPLRLRNSQPFCGFHSRLHTTKDLEYKTSYKDERCEIRSIVSIQKK